MTQPQPQLEAVAEAIWKARWPEREWPDAGVYQDYYRRMAQAALDALQLTPEWTWNWDTGYPPPHDQGYGFSCDTHREAAAEDSGIAPRIVSRLVSPWVAVPQQENQQ